MRAAHYIAIVACLLPPALRADDIFASGFEGCQQITSRLTILPWQSLFLSPWPSQPGGVVEFNDNADITYAIEFVATSTTFGYGMFQADVVPGSDEGEAAMSISTVPACFDSAAVAPLCRSVGTAPFVGWKTSGNAPYCQLTIGTRYYLNFSYGPGTAPPGPYCSGTCIRRIGSYVQ